jgi:ketosteroid isomerase-like protein
MASEVVEALKRSIEEAYAAFNRRDIRGALALMSPSVVWANGMEGGVVVGHDAVREYWSHQWELIDPHVEPFEFTDDGGRVVVTVRQQVRDKQGNEISSGVVHHVYDFDNGLVQSMEIRS